MQCVMDAYPHNFTDFHVNVERCQESCVRLWAKRKEATITVVSSRFEKRFQVEETSHVVENFWPNRERVDSNSQTEMILMTCESVELNMHGTVLTFITTYECKLHQRIHLLHKTQSSISDQNKSHVEALSFTNLHEQTVANTGWKKPGGKESRITWQKLRIFTQIQ
jgi:hypothetical protein